MKNSQLYLDLLAHSSVAVEYLSQEFQNHDSNILYCPEIMLLSLSLFQNLKSRILVRIPEIQPTHTLFSHWLLPYPFMSWLERPLVIKN